jgi:hypothetical protein
MAFSFLSKVSGLSTGYASTASVSPQYTTGAAAPVVDSNASLGTVYETSTPGTYICEVTYSEVILPPGTSGVLPIVHWSVHGTAVDDFAPIALFTPVDALLTAASYILQTGVGIDAFPFFMTLSSDHYSPATGLSITAARSQNGGGFFPCDNAATETGNGWYQINLSDNDMNAQTIALNFAGPASDTARFNLVTQA